MEKQHRTELETRDLRIQVLESNIKSVDLRLQLLDRNLEKAQTRLNEAKGTLPDGIGSSTNPPKRGTGGQPGQAEVENE